MNPLHILKTQEMRLLQFCYSTVLVELSSDPFQDPCSKPWDGRIKYKTYALKKFPCYLLLGNFHLLPTDQNIIFWLY